MTNYLAQITPEMTQTVDRLLATNFEGATQEEIELYATYNTLIALHSNEVEERARIRNEEFQQRKELYRQQADSAINALDALASLAQAKLHAIEGGD